MSGTAEPVRAPKTDAEWARDTSRRLDSVENPTSQRIGEWVLSTSADGKLIGSHVQGGSAVLARKPASGEQDPDTIADGVPACVTAIKLVPESVTSAGATITFDGVALQQGGNWTAGKTSFTGVIVPRDGVYAITATAWFSTGNATLSATVLVEGLTMLGSRVNDSSGDTWMSVHVSGQLRLTAGQSVALFVVAAGVTRSVGAASVFSQSIPTMLSLSQIGD